MQLTEVDPSDGPAFAAWHAVAEAARAADHPDDAALAADELRAQALACGSGTDGPVVVRLLAVSDGPTTVGAASVELPQRDNRHVVEVPHLAVLPRRRREGVGTRLLAGVEALASQEGREVLIAELNEPRATVGRSAGRAFARARSFSPGRTEVRRDLDLPVDPALLDALERQAAGRARGYAVRTWVSSCPDELLEDRALLSRRMSTDAPHGELPLEEKDWDGDRVRRAEALLRAQGRERLGAGAVHEASGRMVAFTELAYSLAQPQRALQWDTLVLREHRGHRLGLLLKVANVRLLTARSPATRRVSTWNAVDNAPMVAVNEALGARANGQVVEWLRRVPPAPPGAAAGS